MNLEAQMCHHKTVTHKLYIGVVFPAFILRKVRQLIICRAKQSQSVCLERSLRGKVLANHNVSPKAQKQTDLTNPDGTAKCISSRL